MHIRLAWWFYFLFEPWLFSTLEKSPHNKFQNFFLYCVINSSKNQEKTAVFTGREQDILYLMLQQHPDLEEAKHLQQNLSNLPQSLFYQIVQRNCGGKNEFRNGFDLPWWLFIPWQFILLISNLQVIWMRFAMNQYGISLKPATCFTQGREI